MKQISIKNFLLSIDLEGESRETMKKEKKVNLKLKIKQWRNMR
jgi:hypothetical protein